MQIELFGTSMTSIYWTILLISASLTVIYVLFGDALEAIVETLGFLNPTLVLAFFVLGSATGLLLEKTLSWSHGWILVLSILIAVILDTLLNVFVLIPLSSAEESLVYTTRSLKGRVGRVIIPIPEDGFGEVVIENTSGRIPKAASSFNGESIEEGTEVLVIDVQDGVIAVAPYHSPLKEDYHV